MLELSNPDEARTFLLQGLCLQRIARPTGATVSAALQWLLEMAAAGHAVPPIGFVGDVGQIVFGPAMPKRDCPESTSFGSVLDGLLRMYDDSVLGKLHADDSFERAAEALRKYKGRDHARGLAYLIQQMQQRWSFACVLINPALVKSIVREDPDLLIEEAWHQLQYNGPIKLLIDCYESLIKSARSVGDGLGAEDLFELEHGLALTEYGQRVALRQTLSISEALNRGLPLHRPVAARILQEMPTHIRDEDAYPVGGYSSLATRGPIESLVQSQLAYMEPSDRPDLFDVKYVRDELLYYSRDENNFWRERRSYVFVLQPDLEQARFKDADAPCQRIIFCLACVVTTIRKLQSWLCDRGLQFNLFFRERDGKHPLTSERKLLEIIFQEQLANGQINISTIASMEEVIAQCKSLAKRHRVKGLLVDMHAQPLNLDMAQFGALSIGGLTPQLNFTDGPAPLEMESAMEAWIDCADRLLRNWV